MRDFTEEEKWDLRVLCRHLIESALRISAEIDPALLRHGAIGGYFPTEYDRRNRLKYIREEKVKIEKIIDDIEKDYLTPPPAEEVESGE